MMMVKISKQSVLHVFELRAGRLTTVHAIQLRVRTLLSKEPRMFLVEFRNNSTRLDDARRSDRTQPNARQRQDGKIQNDLACSAAIGKSEQDENGTEKSVTYHGCWTWAGTVDPSAEDGTEDEVGQYQKYEQKSSPEGVKIESKGVQHGGSRSVIGFVSQLCTSPHTHSWLALVGIVASKVANNVACVNATAIAETRRGSLRQTQSGKFLVTGPACSRSFCPSTLSLCAPRSASPSPPFLSASRSPPYGATFG